MNTPSFNEDHISQIPALQMLINLGYNYLSQEEALQARGNKTSNVILDDILRKQLREIKSIQLSSSKTSFFSEANIENGIRALKEVLMIDGFISASEKVYKLLTLGKALEQSVDEEPTSKENQRIITTTLSLKSLRDSHSLDVTFYDAESANVWGQH
jgi:type I restriction enzyme R subunit